MRRRLAFFLAAAACCLLNAPPAHAGQKAELRAVEQKLAQEKQNRQHLAAQVKDASRDLKSTRSEMVDAAAAARDGERNLQALEAKMADLQGQETALKSELDHDYGSLGNLILALVRMRRLPPETLIIRPGAPLQTAETATLLKGVLPVLESRAKDLSDRLEKLKDVRNSLDAATTQAKNEKGALDKKYAAIAALAAKREKLYRQMNANYAQSTAAVAQLADQAQNLQDLLNRLAAQPPPHEDSSPPLPGHGEAHLPVAGRIVTGFGQRDKIGAISQGLTIRSSARALVTAPMSGTVRFAGAFRDYGQIVLLQHGGGYYSLIAGLASIDAATGQNVSAGEPVGKLPAASSRGGPPTLYYELRYNQQPVNPAGKFADLRARS